MWFEDEMFCQTCSSVIQKVIRNSNLQGIYVTGGVWVFDTFHTKVTDFPIDIVVSKLWSQKNISHASQRECHAFLKGRTVCYAGGVERSYVYVDTVEKKACQFMVYHFYRHYQCSCFLLLVVSLFPVVVHVCVFVSVSVCVCLFVCLFVCLCLFVFVCVFYLSAYLSNPLASIHPDLSICLPACMSR